MIDGRNEKYMGNNRKAFQTRQNPWFEMAEMSSDGRVGLIPGRPLHHLDFLHSDRGKHLYEWICLKAQKWANPSFPHKTEHQSQGHWNFERDPAAYICD